MEDEYQVLSYLQENEITTQRKISSRTGLSLGTVNLLLKKMIRKGLIKVEKINARSMRYILTPRGLQEKARLTYLFIKSSYNRILKINRALDELIAAYKAGGDGAAVVLYGPEDEIFEIISRHLDYRSIPYRHYSNHYNQGKGDLQKRPLVITWREEEESNLEESSRAVNVMKIT